MLRFKYSGNTEELINNGTVNSPSRGTVGSAGYDIFLPIKEEIKVFPNSFEKLSLGISFETDLAVRAELFMRSSTPKTGIITTKPVITFNSGEEFEVSIYNYSDETIVIKPNDRLLQVIFTDSNEPVSPDLSLGTLFEPTSSNTSYSRPFTRTKIEFDFVTPIPVKVNSREINLTFTDIKAKCKEGSFIQLSINPVVNELYGVCMANGFGIIDSSYYNNNKNEGNIGIPLFTLSDFPTIIPEGIIIASAVTRKYFTVDNEITVDKVREGGFGSTNK